MYGDTITYLVGRNHGVTTFRPRRVVWRNTIGPYGKIPADPGLVDVGNTFEPNWMPMSWQTYVFAVIGVSDVKAVSYEYRSAHALSGRDAGYIRKSSR